MAGAPVKVVPKSQKFWDNYDSIFRKSDESSPAPEWKPNSLNKEFWVNTLVNRTVTGLGWDDAGLEYLQLDNGVKVYTPRDGKPLYVKQEDVDQTSFSFMEAK
jgi:hypothetical protein